MAQRTFRQRPRFGSRQVSVTRRPPLHFRQAGAVPKDRELTQYHTYRQVSLGPSRIFLH